MYFVQEPLYASHNTKGADVMTLDQPIEGTNVTGGAFERSCGKSGKLWYFVAAFISFLIPSQFLMRFISAVYHFWIFLKCEPFQWNTCSGGVEDATQRAAPSAAAQGLAGPPASLKLLRGDIEAQKIHRLWWRFIGSLVSLLFAFVGVKLSQKESFSYWRSKITTRSFEGSMPVCMESPTDFARPLWWHRGTTEIMKWTYNSSLRTSTSLRTAACIALHDVLQLCWHSKYHQIISIRFHQMPASIAWSRVCCAMKLGGKDEKKVIHYVNDGLNRVLRGNPPPRERPSDAEKPRYENYWQARQLSCWCRETSINFRFFLWVALLMGQSCFFKRYVMEALADAIALVENSNGGKLKPSKMFKRLELWQKSMYQSRPPEST